MQSQSYKFTLGGMLKFECISLLGRMFLSKSRTPDFTSQKFATASNYLNLGCGSNILSITEINRGGGVNIVNADFFSHLKPFKKYATPMPQWQMDLRYPLRCPDSVFDGVFSEHVLEHFYIDDAIALLREIYRILRPNGTLRLSVPDLGQHVEQYLAEKASNNDKRAALASDYIRKLTQDFWHLSVWDCDRLAYELGQIGFAHIKQEHFRNGRDSNLLFDLESRQPFTAYIEASKP